MYTININLFVNRYLKFISTNQFLYKKKLIFLEKMFSKDIDQQSNNKSSNILLLTKHTPNSYTMIRKSTLQLKLNLKPNSARYSTLRWELPQKTYIRGEHLIPQPIWGNIRKLRRQELKFQQYMTWSYQLYK